MYKPSEKILKNYADVLVKFALNGGKGIKEGDVVLLSVPESAKPLLKQLQISVLEALGYPLIDYMPDGLEEDIYKYGNEEQIKRIPKDNLLHRNEHIKHRIRIDSEFDKDSLNGIDSNKIIERETQKRSIVLDILNKSTAGKLSRTIGIYGTQSMADYAGLSLEEYRNQIINACFLDKENPLSERQNIFEQISSTKTKLDALDIDYLHIKGEKVDLKVKIGKNRKWLGGTGQNIPSFEVYISPDFRGTEGYIYFEQPLFYCGKLIKDIYLEFNNGIVTKATASQNEDALLEMIAKENANRIGEFSLTDRRTSRITKFMCHTLFDENVGGDFGNTHIALGNAYKNSFIGDIQNTTKEERAEMGYNESAVHTDIVSTSNRTVTAYLVDGTAKIIYQGGEFIL